MKTADDQPQPRPRPIKPMHDTKPLSWPSTIVIALALAIFVLWAVSTLPMPV